MAIPSDISGLVLWYKPDNAATRTMSGANVTAITGHSGYGASLSATTGGVTLGSQLSRDTLLFGSGTSGLTGTLAAVWTSHQYSSFAAFKHNNVAEFTRGISLQSSDSGNDYGNANSSIPLLATSGVPGFHRNGGAVNAPAAYTGAWHVASTVTTTIGVTLKIDGTTVATGSQANTALSAEWFGIGGQAMGNQTGDGWRGEFGEVVIFNRTLNSTEQTQMNDYLVSGWVTGVAPGTWAGTPATVTVTAVSDVWSTLGSLARVQRRLVTAFSDQQPSAAFSSPLSVGTLLICAIGTRATVINSISDTAGHTWTSRGTANVGSGDSPFYAQVWTAPNTGTTTPTVTVNTNQSGYSRWMIGLCEYSGAAFHDAKLEGFVGATSYSLTTPTTAMTSGGGMGPTFLFHNSGFPVVMTVPTEVARDTTSLVAVFGDTILTADAQLDAAFTLSSGQPNQILIAVAVAASSAAAIWTASPATVTVTAASGTWDLSGFWAGSPATVTVTAASGTWSVPSIPGTGWTDTDFVNINSGGNYDTFLGNVSFPWRVGTGEVQGPLSNQYAGSRRLDACVGESQYVKITVNSLGTHAQVFTHAPTPMIEYGGYYARWLGDQVYWYQDGAFSGNNSYTPPAGGGTIELRTVAGVSSLYINGALAATKTWGTLITGRPYQGFAANADNVVITDAEGGALAGPLTWTRSLGAVTVTGTPGVWSQTGPQTWYGSAATVTVTAASDLWAHINPGGMMLGTAAVRSIRLGSTAVTAAYMGQRRVWPSVPQTWTASEATISVAGGGGSWYLPGMWVFADSFTAGMGHWSPARWNAENWNTDPGHVFNSNGVAGLNNQAVPNDVVISGNRLWVCAGSQNYGDAICRCDQPFEFAGGGIIEVDAIIPANDTLLGWPQLMVTNVPLSNPMSQGDNANGPIPQYGFTIRLNAGTISSQPTPTFVIWTNYVESGVAPSGTPLVTSRTEPTTVRIEFTHSHINTFANGVAWTSNDWTLPSTLTEGFVYLGAHNHASLKYRSIPSSNAVFAGVRFDGIPRTATKVSRVPDALVSHTRDGVGGTDIGYTLPATLTLPSVQAGVTSARLVLSIWVNGTLPDSTARLTYQLNGGTVHSVAFDPPVGALGSGARNFSIPVTVSELLAGNNLLVISGTGVGIGDGYFPFMGNIQLVYTT